MLELCFEYLFVPCICLYGLIMSHMRFRLNPHIQATIECGFTQKCICDGTRTYSQMHCTDKYSQHSLIMWPLWLNG